MEDNYTKAYQEVVEILKYIPKESVNKIPKEMIDMFEEEQSKTHNFKIDITKPFEEQEILEETKAILANIYRDYWATPEQKAKIIAKENYDREVLEQEKREMHSPDDIFKKRNEPKIEKKEEMKSGIFQMIEYKESIFQRFINIILGFLHIK